MDTSVNQEFNLYKDIQARTNGEIYIGVVGPVRTGKSTFIKRFMDLMVLPNMKNEYELGRTKDELPQSAGGKTITTTEPKFIPKEAAEIELDHDSRTSARVRMIDCVGYMVDGASGHIEDAKERMVRTPWFDYEIPFTQAAEIGTKKVINDHSTVGIVVTTDASFSEIDRENYIPAEMQTIQELKRQKKPFIVLVNSERPHGEEANRIAAEIESQYQVTTFPVNCEQLKKEDIHRIMESLLYEFPLSAIEFHMPKWMELLPDEHVVKTELVNCISNLMKDLNVVRDVAGGVLHLDSDYIRNYHVDQIDTSTGCAKVDMDIDDSYYYEMLSDLMGEPINSEYQLMHLLQEMSAMKKEYTKVLNAMQSVRYKGYGVVTPERDEIELSEPEIIKHGNKYGVKIKAESPSVHFIRANIETEITPIVGTEEQAEDLMKFISQTKSTADGIWETNIFGKSIEQLVNDGISNKIAMIGDESQMKLQETMQKIVNDSNGGIVCIII